MSEPISILSTKKLNDGALQALSDAGFLVTDHDFISIRNKPFALSQVMNNLIFTSQNAVKAVCDHPDVQEIRRNPVFCVGEKTAELLDELGFTVLASADYGAELARIITREYQSVEFTFFCGNIRRDELPTQLTQAAVDFNEIEVYETVLTPVRITSTVNAILFFSPSAVDSFLSENEFSDQVCFCIGTTTADHVKNASGSKPVKVVTADKPTIESTIKKCVNHFKQT